MENTAHRAIAIVGTGAVLPDAPNVAAFWQNVKTGRDCITEVKPDRWDQALYYDADPAAPDKTYSKIGGWVREFDWNPMKWKLAIPPRVADAMDIGQQWAVACTREALEDFGYPARTLDLDRTAVILGNAMAGEKHYLTALRISFPEYARELSEAPSFAALPEAMRRDITRELHSRITRWLPEITEDTMPGELANCIAGRVANTFNCHGPNFTADAACASAMAAMSAAVEGLIQGHFDAAITGGIDRNMSAHTFVKFCKIGALSATGSRPYAYGADGFVMGEGAAVFIMKRLTDAERDGDRIYCVLRGMGGASDGKGKGITAPNPVGQKLCMERAWQIAGLSPATATLMEGHGTSTRVGDVVEVNSMTAILADAKLPAHSVALGSVKSNIGHLKGGAGAAGLLKAALALRDRILPPSVHCERPNPDIDFGHSPLYVNTALQPWTATADGVRRAGVSAFGFGGTNFHLVLEEYIPHRLNSNGNGKHSVIVGEAPGKPQASAPQTGRKAPLRGALVVGAPSEGALADRLRAVNRAAAAGGAPAPAAPSKQDLRAPERIAIDYADAAELADKSAKALKALTANQPAVWKALRAQGIFRGQGPAPKVAFLYTGQGSQYVNMLRPLRDAEPIVGETFAQADRVMTPLLGKPLTDFIYVDSANPTAVAKAEDDLRQTAITQPAVLATDESLTRLFAAYGIRPDMTIGHSLGEYGALVASGAMPFEDALEAVSARGREMTRVSMADNGRMAAVFAPIAEIERILQSVDGYVVIANINSQRQAVIGGASKAVETASERLLQAGYNVVPLPVSHAFHTSIVAPAAEPLRRMLERLHIEAPRIPIVANVDGQFYPTGAGAVPKMLDILGRQIAAPVQFVKGLETLYNAGARVFVETGPKKALQGFAEDVLGDRPGVVSLFANHPKVGDIVSFNQALCGLYAAGFGGAGVSACPQPEAASEVRAGENACPPTDRYQALGHLFADFLERGMQIHRGQEPMAAGAAPPTEPVAITGAALGLPGTERIFDDSNLARIMAGEQFIRPIPGEYRQAILDKHITRLVKTDNGGPTFEAIQNVADVIKLAGRGGAFDLQREFGVPADRLAAFDRDTRLAIAVGLDALRDAGIPLVMRYKTTSKGTQLPDRWGLPDGMRDDTGVIFASCFAGLDSFADEAARYYGDRSRREQLAMLERLRISANGSGTAALDREIAQLRAAIARGVYEFDRRMVFRVLPMGHSQFAEFIGARGPNTQVNSACASTTQAIAVADDWIHAGRCRRVIIVAADDITSDHLMEWMGAAFLATGAAATDENVAEAALPFDRRRHGMIIGMGAAGLIVESAEAARERGIRPICEVLSAVSANSAYHGTRLDVEHISGIMESLLAKAEKRAGISRRQVAPQMVFVSHETYTPARGGSAAAEIHALRRVFGDVADRIVIANTKGFTGHSMGAGIEDVVAVKALETGCVPPVANFREIDPELGALNLSKGGRYPVEYALRLGAGFGSQISMTLLHGLAPKDAVRPNPDALGYARRIDDRERWNAWLSRMAGRSAADLEVVNRTLRVRDGAVAAPQPPAVEVAKPAPAPPPALSTADPIQEKVLALVAEKTGYPKDMLGLDLDLEADLGVDTVKQADIFATIREAYGIERDDKIRLRDFPTLAHVIRFVSDRLPKPAAPALATPPVVASNPIKDKVLALVAEKTGYPIDMLDLDLDLEADLGVDTVKQADILATIREAYGIERDDKIKLRDFPTLKHVIGFVAERTGQDMTAQPVAAPPAPTPVAASDPIKDKVLALVAEKTGYPIDMLDLDLDLESDLGVDTVKQADILATIREAYGIERDDKIKLRDFPTLKHVIGFVSERTGQKLTAAPIVAVSDPIKDKVLAIVAEKTGYPIDMLDPDLDLEADLGIDTVKQADMFASVREAFGIERDTNLKLRDFPTLGHVMQFARDRATNIATPAPQQAVTAAPLPSPSSAVPRRVPVPRLRPPLSLCKPTGVKLEAGTRVLLVSDTGGAGDALAARLASMGVEVVRDAAAGPVQGVYWLPALDPEGDLALMDLAAWQQALLIRVKDLYATMRANYGAFLISATRLGGKHGYGDAGATAPMGGAVSGFTKAYKRERTEALVKAVDFTSATDPAAIADILIAETLQDNGAVEIGYQNDLRWTIGLEEQPVADGEPGLELGRQTVFVVTGAAGSIVSAITSDLAAASGGTFYLLDIAPEPDPKNPDMARLATDRDGLKRDLFARMQTRGERATPALVEKELATLERAQAAQAAIDAVTAAGGTAHYRAVNLIDPVAVANVIGEVRTRDGRIDVLLHAAGMERSHFLPDKDPREFDLVFDVKSDGWFNLIHAIGDMPLGATVAFSSIAGRFGNGGQSDYSAANDLLCKIASSFRTTHPATRAIVIDWTAWSGIGMAARGSIPKMMELAGIDMLQPADGIPWIRRELTAGNRRGEVVAAQSLGILTQEWDGTAGLEPAAITTRGPMIGNVSMGLSSGLTVEVTLDPAQQPFLHDHQIEGTPVLPGVMGIEAFAEAALAILPGWHVEAIEDVDFMAPFKFYRHEPRTVTVHAQFSAEGDSIVADCRLTGVRTLPNQSEPQMTTHFTARVRLTKQPPAAQAGPAPGAPSEAQVTAPDVYRVYFHGPAYQVVERAWVENHGIVGQMPASLVVNHHPPELPLAAMPRLIELCFQTAGLWEMSMQHRMGLPLRIDRVTLCRAPDGAGAPLCAVVIPNADETRYDADIVDAAGNRYLHLSGYGTAALATGIDAAPLAALHAVMA
jgi:acyl transferase domain-containing protein/acyl carrier protein